MVDIFQRGKTIRLRLANTVSFLTIAGALSLSANGQTQERPATALQAPPSAPSACESLSSFHAPSLEITQAVDQPAGPLQMRRPQGLGPPGQPGGPPPGKAKPAIELPAHCLVKGVIDRRIGVGGKPYGINFELRMPVDWNHRFLFEGGGGTNGSVSPAIGSVKGPPALAKGFAVVTQDGGHEGGDSSFGEDQQARIDMEYRSYDRVTTVAKQLIGAYYGKPADHSYFMGCSEGGREALMVSQRMPLEYDGVVAGDPGFMLGVDFHTTAEHMILASISPKGPDGKPDITKAFSVSDVKLLETTIEDDCDAKDGLKDGLIDNPTACRPNLERLICKTKTKTDECFTKRQVGALRLLFGGGQLQGSGIVAPGYFYDTGVDTPLWKSKLTGGGGLMSRGVGSVQGLFSTPYDPSFDDNSIDFAHGGADRFEEVGSLNRADGVMYSSFKLHGGKLLMYTGESDPAFSAKGLIAYYKKVGDNNGGAEATEDFSRLFIAPGMTHCSGGKSLDNFDPLQSVVDWVENGKAPVQMIATGDAFPGRSRPICAWPLQSRYKMTGSTDDAANFECRAPDPEK